MAELALNDSLIGEYIKYRFQDNFDVNKVRKLLKYIQPFAAKISSHSLFSDPSFSPQLSSDPLINIVPDCSDADLVQNSSLKLMLTDSHTATMTGFISLNIMGLTQKLSVRYSGVYNGRLDKNIAQLHIKALLSDASWVKITDGYIVANGSWGQNKTIVQDIVPHNSLDLTIVGAAKDNRRMQINQTEKDELSAICVDWRIRANTLGNDVHDRYIETNKVKILLSSGLYNLSASSNKDFTYVVEIK